MHVKCMYVADRLRGVASSLCPRAAAAAAAEPHASTSSWCACCWPIAAVHQLQVHRNSRGSVILNRDGNSAFSCGLLVPVALRCALHPSCCVLCPPASDLKQNVC
jgi:hypothetical protein